MGSKMKLIRVVYEKGVFRPRADPGLPDGTRVRYRVLPLLPEDAAAAEQARTDGGDGGGKPVVEGRAEDT